MNGDYRQRMVTLGHEGWWVQMNGDNRKWTVMTGNEW